ncbi:N-acetylglucosamine kinase [Streptomyces odontomachi]|uniref:N-acetylglucosamine kinase n=1 Tax=Streptomyces odontomachi TaxID=2944940 RepID=UPI00210A4A02|nr:BadF/BadG/BcrA/BcrD ATPase family protein [Streptomyces sp. ODS25]
MTPLYLGVDAGNSKTAAMVCAPTGEVVGAGLAGCGDIYGAETPQDAVDEVFAAVTRALDEAGAKLEQLAGAALRLAGVDWPEDREFWHDTLLAHWPAALPRSILNDGYAAIRCGEPSGTGVAVIGGTAAAVAARGPDGALWELAWWGQHPMGALGLAQEAFRAIVLAELGEAPATELARAVLDFYGLDSVRELNHWLTRRVGAARHPDRARCAPAITAAAVHGDPVAMGLVAEQGRRFARYAAVAARQVGLSGDGRPVSVVLSGSVLTAQDSPVTSALLGRLPAYLPDAVVHQAVIPPVGGAALDALAEGGAAPDQDVLERLARSVQERGARR